MPTRLANPGPTPVVSTPRTHEEWSALMRKVIARAETLKHRQLPGLRAALVSGDAEKLLRTLGIIHPNDIDRQMPLPK